MSAMTTQIFRTIDWTPDPELRNFVELSYVSDAEWRRFLGSGAWLCPYCLAPVPPLGSGRKALYATLERHLAISCGPFIARRNRGLAPVY